MVAEGRKISYKLANVINDNYSPKPGCIPANEELETYTDNYFMSVQRNNFWQSNFNETSPVDIPIIMKEMYSDYANDEVDLSSLLQWKILEFRKKRLMARHFRVYEKLTVPDNIGKISKCQIKKQISDVADTIFKELCAERKQFTIDFVSNKNESDDFLRNYLNMKDIKIVNYHTEGLQYVYEMKYCRKVIVIEKIMNVPKKENTCFTKLPVVTENNEIRFADDKNYLHYETKTINCLSLEKTNQLIGFNHSINLENSYNISETIFNTITKFVNDSSGFIGNLSLLPEIPEMEFTTMFTDWISQCFSYLMTNYKYETITFLAIIAVILISAVYFILERCYIITILKFIMTPIFSLLLNILNCLCIDTIKAIFCCIFTNNKNNLTRNKYVRNKKIFYEMKSGKNDTSDIESEFGKNKNKDEVSIESVYLL
uniref:Transmembrane protein n=1 Tax=Strongyloides papillosus TaxID=174720 RepID=A0A0N5BF24_STREA